MKKILTLLLAGMIIFGFIGCDHQVYKLPWDQFCISEHDGTAIELDSKKKQFIIDLLNCGNWDNGITEYSADVKFYTQQQIIEYCAGEGIFNDITLQQSLKISEEDRIIVNMYLEFN